MKKVFLFLSLFLSYACISFGQNNVTGPIVKLPVYFDVSPPLRDMVKNLPEKAETSWKDGIVQNRYRPRTNKTDQPAGGLSDPGLQLLNGTTITDTTIVNFEGNSNTQGYVPPDTYGDVSLSDYFQVVNTHYSIYSKTGTLLLGPLANSSVWNGMTNNSNDGDAIVIYDEQADRWLFSQFSLPNYPNGPFYQMIAVSQTNDPTGSWYRYQYSFANMPDYPKFGVWPDAYYMSMHIFTSGSGSYAGIGAVAYNRALMLAGNPAATMIMFTLSSSNEAYGWLPSDCDGPFPSGNPPNYYVYPFDGTSNDHLGIYEFHVDWSITTNSTFGNFLSLPVNAFTTNITGITQPGTSNKLDPLNDRMMYRLQYRMFSDHTALICNHTVDISSSIAGIRWYELRKTSGAWSIFQQGTYGLADNNNRWMGSIAQDSSGNIALGYSVCGATYPSIRYTGRMKNDPSGQMTIAERGIMNGGGIQTFSQTGRPSRWGDYSSMVCDPAAKETFWYTQEYYSTTSSVGWQTRIASFSFVHIPIVVTLAATSITNTGGTLNGTVNPNGFSSTYNFEWGTTTSYGNTTSTLTAGSGTSAIPESAAISGLSTGQIYHYRINATNSQGTANGNDRTFTPGAASVTTTAASSIGMTTATSGGNVITDGGSPVTTRGVCWATTANPVASGNHTTDGSGPGIFISSITGLSSNTTYHVRAYATNANGTYYGDDLQFTTLCGAYTLPFSESFTNTTIPICWTQIDHQGNGQIWLFGTITGQSPNPALTGNYAYLNSDAYGSGNSQNADLITPTLNLSAYSAVTLQFNHYFKSYTGSSGTLSYSINNGSTWTVLQIFTTTSPSNPTAFSQAVAAVAGQANVKFKWNYTGTWGWYWAIDDVLVTGTYNPTLTVAPANRDVTAAAGTTSFTVTSNSSWTASSNQGWCTVTPSGSGNGTITANYLENTSTSSRVASIMVTVAGLAPVTVTVTQAGAPNKTLNLTLFLQGLFSGTSMNKAQNATGDQFPGNTADQVTVELRNSSTGALVYSTGLVNLSTSGQLTASIPATYSGAYYLYIKHRNSITTSTASAVSFSGSTISYDFTDAITKAYASNMTLVPGGYFAIFGGNANASVDDIVDGTDMSIIDNASIALVKGYVDADVNGDGLVDGSDMALVDNNATNLVSAVLPF